MRFSPGQALRRHRWIPAWAVLVLAAAAPASAESDLEVRTVEVRDGRLSVEFVLSEAFLQKMTDTLERGFSATLTYTIELWEQRRAWFDRLDQTAVLEYRIRYDSWSEEYVAYNSEGEVDAQVSPRDLAVCRQGSNRVPFADVSRLEARDSYFVHLTVGLEPLTVEDIRELEGWLRGTWGEGGPPRTRSFTRGIFGLVKNLTGFSEQVVSARSPAFRPGEVSP